MNLALTTRMDGDIAIVYCGGNLVFGKEASALWETLSNLVKNYRSVVVDLAAVKTIDGSGLGTFAQSIQAARAAGAQLILCRVPNRVRQLLDLTQLSSQLEIAGSENQALEASRAAA